MSSIHSRTTPSGERRWDVYYRGPDNKQRKIAFKRKVDAQRYANTVEADIVRHDWVDPQRGRQPFGDWAAKWIGTTTHLKPKTRESYNSILVNHLLPEFGGRAIGSIDHPEVLTFLSRLTNEGRGAGTVRNIRDVMRLVFKLAVRSGVVKNNPVLDIKAPRANKKEMIFLTDGQVMDLAEEIQDPPPVFDCPSSFTPDSSRPLTLGFLRHKKTIADSQGLPRASRSHTVLVLCSVLTNSNRLGS